MRAKVARHFRLRNGHDDTDATQDVYHQGDEIIYKIVASQGHMNGASRAS